MTSTNNAILLIRRALFPALAILIIANFAGYAVFGSNGILQYGDYRRMAGERSIELAKLEQERDRLAHRATLLDPRKADPDLAEEMVRSELGLVRPDEVVIPIAQ